MATETGLPPQGNSSHSYSQPGTYTVTITDETDASRSKSTTITVPFGPTMTVREDPTDPDRRRVEVTVDNYNNGSVVLSWGDGTGTSTNTGDGTTITRHKYATGGNYTITATDADQSGRSVQQTVSVPFTTQRPAITATEDSSDPQRRTVLVRVDNHGNGPVTLDWDDGTGTDSNAGDNSDVTQHTYTASGRYTIRVTDQDDPTIVGAVTVTIPFSDTTGPGFTLTEVLSDSTRMTTRMSVTNAQSGATYQVQWEQGGAWTDVTGTDEQGRPSTTHQYPEAGTYLVGVRRAGDSAVSRKSVTVPYTAEIIRLDVVPDPANTDGYAMQATVTNPVSGASYEVQWEQGGTWEAMSNAEATHTYASQGSYTVTARKVSDTAITRSVEVTVPYAVTPDLLVTEEHASSRRQARATVRNPVQGRSYEVSWNGGNSWSALSLYNGVPSGTNDYASGTDQFTVMVRDVDDTSASAQQAITLPYSGVAYSLAQGSDTMSVTATLIDTGATYEIEWESGGGFTAITDSASHTYAADGVYEVTVQEQGTASTAATQQAIVPYPSAQAASTTSTTSSRRKR